MKKLYFLICIFFISFSYAQESGAKRDIDGFKLYPNPVMEGKVNIIISANAPKDILIFDVMGTQVLQTTILGSELSLSDLDAGVYVLRVVERDKVATRKLIIK